MPIARDCWIENRMLERAVWPLLETENQAEMLAYLGTASCAQSVYSPGVSWVMTGVDSNDYNGVLWARLSADEADQVHLIGLISTQARPEYAVIIIRINAGHHPADSW